MAVRRVGRGIGILAVAVIAGSACEGDGGVDRPELPAGPDCTVARAFTPCGGDLARTWRLEGVCADGAPWALGPSTYCAGRAGTTDAYRTGIVVVAADSLTVSLSLDLELADFQAPQECFTEACQDARVVDRWDTECVRSGDGCLCAGRHPNTIPAAEPRPARLDGTDLVLLDGQGAETARWPYCVQGDRAVIAATEAPLPGADPVRVLWVLGP